MELFTENPEQKRRLPVRLEENAAFTHECNMLKLVFLSSGKGNICLDGRDICVDAPAVVCLNERESFKTAGSGTLAVRFLYFSPSVINSAFNMENISGDIKNLPETVKLDHYYFTPFLRNEGQKAGIVKLDRLTAGRMTAVLEALKTQLANFGDSFWPCRSRSHLIELLFVIRQCSLRQQEKAEAVKTANSGISDILHYLNMNYDRKISIDEISRQFHTNRNSLNKNFRNATGQSVFDYLIKVRIEAACGLLRNTSLPVSEIALRVGFSDLSYWGRAFRKSTGCTPSEYRRKVLGG